MEVKQSRQNAIFKKINAAFSILIIDNTQIFMNLLLDILQGILAHQNDTTLVLLKELYSLKIVKENCERMKDFA